MTERTGFTSDIAFTPAVKAQQDRLGSRAGYQRAMEKRDWSNRITEDLAAFIAERNSFYLGSAGADGQPYIQHRGGPAGFLKVLDDRRLAIADFSGNRQYITLGNLTENDRVFIFLMDYANRRRVKIWARASFIEDDPDLLAELADPSYRADVERALVFTVEAWDTNCPQHIPQKFDAADIAGTVAALRGRIAELEAELARRDGSAPPSET